MEIALRAALLAAAGVSALVGTRIDWGLRSPTLPAVRMMLVSKVPFYTYAGADGLIPHRVQVDCFGRTYAEAKAVARAVEAAIATLGRPSFDACFVELERDDQDTDVAGNPVHRTSLDVRIWHHAS